MRGCRLLAAALLALGFLASTVSSSLANEPLRALGERLFFDKRLSADGSIACADCHDPAQAFTTRGAPRARGVGGQVARRNAPTLLNLSYYARFHQDGAFADLETQAWSPLLNPSEMGNQSAEAVVARLAALPEYRDALGGGPAAERRIGAALAAYQRSLATGPSRFDRWWSGADPAAITAEERAGFALFRFRAGCAQCHRVDDANASFADGRFHNIGSGGRHADSGLAGLTGDTADRWKYRTPSLRNVSLTAPYMHDGGMATLEDVVEFYDRGGGDDPQKAEWLFPIGLTQAEKAALVAFLKTLDGGPR